MSDKPWAYLDALEIADDAPISDNPSGTYCSDCRATGFYHCSAPEWCGGLKPMKPREDQLTYGWRPERRQAEEALFEKQD